LFHPYCLSAGEPQFDRTLQSVSANLDINTAETKERLQRARRCAQSWSGTSLAGRTRAYRSVAVRLMGINPGGLDYPPLTCRNVDLARKHLANNAE
jgi:hypothetical protein